MTCPRCALAALLFCLLAFFGCDSNNPGGDLTEFEGRYAFTTFVFTSTGVQPANVMERLDPGHGNELEVDGSGNGILRYRRIDATSRIVTLDAHATGGVLILTPVRQDDANNIARELLFPLDGTLQLETSGGTLTATRENYTVNLHEFDPEAYGPSLNAVEGTLTVAFTEE